MSRKEMVMCGGHRWAFVPAHRQALPPLPSMKSEGQQLLRKSLFPPRGCCCPSASLWMQSRWLHVCVSAAAGGAAEERRAQNGGQKGFWGTPAVKPSRVWAQAMVLPTTLQPSFTPTKLRVSSLPNCPSSWAPFRPQLSKESKVSAQAASHIDYIHLHGSIARRPIVHTEPGRMAGTASAG